MATNLTIKGQVTVPKRVRDYLGLFTAKSRPVATLSNQPKTCH